MISIDIPGFGPVNIEFLVLDFSGTLSVDGAMPGGVKELLDGLAKKVEIHIVTADTHGTARAELGAANCKLVVIKGDNLHFQKEKYVGDLGAEKVFAIGNGNNDTLMLSAAKIGVAVCLGEGVSAMAVNHSDIVCFSIESALELLVYPERLIATLRF